MKSLSLFALFALVSVFVLPSLATAAEESRLTADPQVLAQGARIYAKNCASCHGVNLEGQANWRVRKENGRMPAPPHDTHGQTWHRTNAILFGITKLGTQAFTGLDVETDMPGFKGVLSDDQIWAVLAYIKSTWPLPIRQQQDLIDRNIGRD